MPRESRFLDLRRVADWLSLPASETTLAIRRALERLRASSVPLLSRTLRGGDDARRTAAREALAFVASLDDGARARVIDELKDIAGGASSDDGKLSAIGLLADLGASIRSSGIARFADPEAVQRRSATALAAQLETAADIAKAADLMIRELAIADAVHMVAVMAEVAPAIAHRLVIELRARCDLPDELRDELPSSLASIDALPEPATRPRPARTVVLGDGSSRLVVIATRKLIGARRWRRWAVLVAPGGRIDDCLHEDDADADADALVDGLVGDGYHIVSRDHDDARDAVAAAARMSTAATHALPPAYYLGRDLLDLGNAHLSSAAPLDRAVELIASGDHVAASALLAEIAPPVRRSDRLRAILGDAPHPADLAATTAACLLAQDRNATEAGTDHASGARGRAAEAAEWLVRAIAAEPAWPLHHWNLAVALHRLGDAAGCFDALTRFVRTSAAPTGLAGDPDQPARLACAEHMLRDLERAARLRGNALRTRRRRKRR
jgi:hypothetical protein